MPKPLLAAVLAFAALAANAGEVRVLAAGAAKHAIETLAPAFERASGHTLEASFDTVGAQRDRVLNAQGGSPADVVVLSDAALSQLRAARKLAAVEPVPLGSVKVALAVPANAPAPALGSADELRDALLAAPSIAYADPARGATAGTHLARVVDALGLRDALQPRLTVLPFGVEVIAAVAQGRFALGVSQSSEIVQHPGVKLAGALPPPYAQATGYSAAATADNAAARAFLDFLRTPAARAALRESGFL